MKRTDLRVAIKKVKELNVVVNPAIRKARRKRQRKFFHAHYLINEMLDKLVECAVDKIERTIILAASACGGGIFWWNVPGGN